MAPPVSQERLARRGIPVTVRDTRGREIDGACGQLAALGPDGADRGSADPGSADPGSGS